MAMEQDADSRETDFWNSALVAFQKRGGIQGPEIDMLTRYADHQSHPEPHMAVAMLRMLDVMSKTRKAASAFLLDNRIEAFSPDMGLQHGVIVSLAMSPAIGADKALVVTEDELGGLVATVRPLESVVKIFPAIQPFVVGDGVSLIVKNGQWGAVLDVVDGINGHLMSARARGEGSK